MPVYWEFKTKVAAVCFFFVDHFSRKKISSKTATQHSSNLAFVVDSGNLHSSSHSIVQLDAGTRRFPV